ncbi:major facilitator superfamily domain-containing protein [Trichophaea hybrida]|nr:major facilitator superfamily domain-containing protein [Trichophaea hybrida]
MSRWLLRHLPLSPSVRPLHAATYLLAVPLFSIAFLVFLNSSLSFLLTNLFHVAPSKLGSIVGTLGFVDELVAIVAAPLWGVVSDGRIGTRGVSALGYLAICGSLVMFVQLQSVYPGLIFGRIIFALGSAAVTTMVSAILPEMMHPQPRAISSSLGEEEEDVVSISPPTGQLAGMVGVFTGFGALLALGLFLPLPTLFSHYPDVTPAHAVKISYFIVSGIALSIAVWCYFGLPPPRNPGNTDTWQDIKTWVWTKIWGGDPVFVSNPSSGDSEDEGKEVELSGIRGLGAATKLALSDGRIGVAYVGGFVARASSVGISLFIPLFVNHYFITTGRCNPTLPGLSKECRKANILASTLTGTSQLTALLLAPLFGLLTDRLYATPHLRNVPLILSSSLGILSFTLFSLLPTPQCTAAFIYAALAGASQIGAIVSSLGLLSRGIVDVASTTGEGEEQSLLGRRKKETREAFKGSIAGVYSLFGAAAILILTKAGGKAFDSAAGAPFWMLAGFNAVLVVVAVGNAIWTGVKYR